MQKVSWYTSGTTETAFYWSGTTKRCGMSFGPWKRALGTSVRLGTSCEPGGCLFQPGGPFASSQPPLFRQQQLMCMSAISASARWHSQRNRSDFYSEFAHRA